MGSMAKPTEICPTRIHYVLRSTFSEALARGVLVFDGAMGTEIYRHHVFTNRSFDELCLSDAQADRDRSTASTARPGPTC